MKSIGFILLGGVLAVFDSQICPTIDFNPKEIFRSDTLPRNNQYIFIAPFRTDYTCFSIFDTKIILKFDTIVNRDKSFAIGETGKCDSINSLKFKVGKWTEFYKSGTIKAMGNYSLEQS